MQLEIITDQEYFERLFMTPQSADILIVSEDLYDMSLQKHNIKNIFVMTEQHEEDQTEELNITKIFKYSSIKGIFNEILGQSAKDLKLAEEARTEPQIVVVTSAAGGVGKTTVAMGMCACLSQNYKRSCISMLLTYSFSVYDERFNSYFGYGSICTVKHAGTV